jgi:hypothetical protein
MASCGASRYTASGLPPGAFASGRLATHNSTLSTEFYVRDEYTSPIWLNQEITNSCWTVNPSLPEEILPSADGAGPFALTYNEGGACTMPTFAFTYGINTNNSATLCLYSVLYNAATQQFSYAAESGFYSECNYNIEPTNVTFTYFFLGYPPKDHGRKQTRSHQAIPRAQQS